ncbi:MAG: hypothetical protein ACRD01_00870 [Terriglobales bacterium]
MGAGCSRWALSGVAACLLVGAAAQRIAPPANVGPKPVTPQANAAKTIPPPPKDVARLPAHESMQIVTAPQPDPLIAGHDIQVGTFYFNRGDYVGALARFEDALYNDPHSAEAFCRMGDAQLKLHHLLPARVAWTHCQTVAQQASQSPDPAQAESGRKWATEARKQLRKHPNTASVTAPAHSSQPDEATWMGESASGAFTEQSGRALPPTEFRLQPDTRGPRGAGALGWEQREGVLARAAVPHPAAVWGGSPTRRPAAGRRPVPPLATAPPAPEADASPSPAGVGVGPWAPAPALAVISGCRGEATAGPVPSK